MKEKESNLSYNPRYPSIRDLQIKAKKRIPQFAFEYLEGGCNDDINLKRNMTDLQEVMLMPQYLKKYTGIDITSCKSVIFLFRFISSLQPPSRYSNAN